MVEASRAPPPTAPVASSASQGTAPGAAMTPNTLLAQLPPHIQQQLAGMTKERLQQIVSRMQLLRSHGHNEQSNPEFAALAQTLKTFQYLQQLRMQQLAPTQATKSSQSQSLPQNVSQASSFTQAQPLSTTPSVQPSAPDASVLTQDQIQGLRTQVSAYKHLARNQPMASQLQHQVSDLSASDTAAAASVANKVSDAAADSHAALVAAHGPDNLRKAVSEVAFDAGESSNVPQDDRSSRVYPYNAYLHPFTILAKPSMKGGDDLATLQQRLLVPSLLPAGIDAHLLLEERERFIQTRIQQRIRELESFPATIAQVPTYENASSDPSQPKHNNAKVKALIELKSLHLLERQKHMREKVISSMNLATSLGLDRSAFRRVRKQALRDARVTEQLERKQRTERERKVKQRHTDYLTMICNHGKDMLAAHGKSTDQAKKIGRMVLKFHADTEREEQKRIERLAKDRLNALKADDEEAYLKLIDTAKDTRITHLLQQTDAYLDSLAQAVRAQQDDDSHIDWTTTDGTEGAAVDETTFGASRQDDAGDDNGRVDYYSVAHRITEKITEQPSILVGGKLKDYQMKGLQWMVSLYNNRLNGILADEMGLGKTIQTISLITFLIENKKQNGPYLVIVPLSTLTNWANEFYKWAPSVTTLVYKGTPNVRKQLAGQLKMGSFQVLLTTYEYIIKEKSLLGKIKWTHMIIDEGHRMKNTQSKLAVTLTQSYSSRYRLLLTGTPLQNNLPELWALLNFVLPKIFNSVKSFDEWFNTPFVNTGTGDNSMQLSEEEALLIIKRLHKVLRPFLLRRLKKDVESELPDKVEKVITCRMSALQVKLYQQMKRHKVIVGDAGAGNGKGNKPMGIRGLQNAIMQLRKICNHPYAFEQVEATINPTKENGPDLYRVAGKFELLDRILPKLFASGHRVLIFFQMTAIMDIMEDFLRFRGIKYLRLDGSTKPDDRSVLLKLFNDPQSEYNVFILSTRAGGLGLNLQSADTVIIYDSDWNPHQDLQAQDRAHRIGQKVEVRILRLVTDKSVEKTILSRAQSKLEINGKVIQAGKFDNQATADERELLLRAMLEADHEEEEEDQGELNDEELNELLARSEEEVAIFQQVDRDRIADEETEWRALGNTGPVPERLIQESELPEIYQRDFDTEAIDVIEEEQPLTRRRNVVRYDDGLTEDQFLRALEDEEDLTEVAERKRERAEKRRLKQLGQDDGAEARSASPTSQNTGERKRKLEVNDADQTASQVDSGFGSTSDDTPKRRKMDSDAVRLKEAMLKCYFAVEQCEEPETGRLRSVLFMDIPKKNEYPDYHVLIARPVCLKQIKRRIETRAYKTLEACRNDFRTMFNNARTYNQEGSVVWIDAQEMEQVFDKSYSAVEAELSAIKADPASGEEESELGNTTMQDSDSVNTEPTTSDSHRQKTGMKIKLSIGGRRKRS